MARLKEQRVTDLVTADGELWRVQQQRDPGKTYGRQFVIVFTDQLDELATKIGQGLTLKVMLKLPKRLSFTEFRFLNQAELAAELGTGQGAISRCLSQLLDLGVIEREGKGPRTKWRLSNDWGWQGTADQWHAMRAGRLKGKKPPIPEPANAQSCIMNIMETQTLEAASRLSAVMAFGGR